MIFILVFSKQNCLWLKIYQGNMAILGRFGRFLPPKSGFLTQI